MTSTSDINRRTLLASALAAGGFAVSGAPGFAQNSAFAGKTVLAGLSGGGSWRDSIDKLIGERIRAMGGKIDYVIDAPQGNIAKLFAARGGAAPFDVLESGPHLVPLAARAVVDLDYAKIPNAKALPSYARGKDFVWNCASQDGIVYNADIFKQNGIPIPEYYKDLAHPKLKGKVAIPDVNHVQHWNAVVGMAYDGGGSETAMEKAIPVINNIRPSYFFATSTDLGQKMSSGEIWAAAWHSGWAVRLRKSGVPLAAVYPKIANKRGALWPVILQLTKGAPQPDFGLKFIDLYLDPEIQSVHSKATGVVPVNPAATATLAADPIVKEIMLLDQKDIDNLYVVDFGKLDQAKWRDAWNKEVIRS
ncbi:MAG: PotD/PotF family extracellular solute-binding protein [Pseudorhodoplanes sp.]